ncbi:sigma-70 family RNA polymerase sigma factor [Streptomyces europaeiscabiei]|uniref:sigma-70 family RNA polymerase sigma factor n=1 Tax=Streptomyces europaeiscabiei TaxID=146819 RepID=UPI0029B4F791|nr:sigma-70 family RNA polymerase sigma factor [Streptomyces europaeiscabiei]MDX3689562.1 sigma-70 family RNA polymerase sigma factor [Streptomyces europaeiscabiei]
MTDGPSASATATYTRIYEEQHPRLVAYARSLTRNSWTAEDLVAEAHFRVWRRLSAGHEIDNVPAYLTTTVRHLAAAVGTATRETPLDPTAPERAEADVRLADGADPAEQVSSVDLLVRVLGQLPERWVRALWLAEAEGQPLETVGQRIGAKQGATAVLLHRAREGMRQAFLREQPGSPIDPACQVRWGRMPAYVRGTATSRQSQQLLGHVDACDDCRARLAVLMRTNDRLPALVGPALLVFVVGGGGGKLLLSLTAGSAGTAAVLGGVGGHGAGQLLHAVRQAATGGAGGAKVPAVAAVGAAAAAAAVVAGIVLAPLDSDAVPPRRMPVAQAPVPHRPEVHSPEVVDRRSAVTDAVASTGTGDAPRTDPGGRDTVVIQAADDSDAGEEPTVGIPAGDDTTPADETAPDTDPDAPTGGGEANKPEVTAPEPPDEGSPDAPGTPEIPGTPEAPQIPESPGTPGGDTPVSDAPADETPEPVTPGGGSPGAEEPGAEVPGVDTPEVEEPGAEVPGAEEPGAQEPGAEEPGTEQPGAQEPGVEEPGAEEPGTDYPEVDGPGAEAPGTDAPPAENPAPEIPAPAEPAPAEEAPAEETPAPPEPVDPAPETPAPVEPSPETPAPGGGC